LAGSVVNAYESVEIAEVLRIEVPQQPQWTIAENVTVLPNP